MKHTEGNILIVDDNVDVLFSAKMLLKDHFKTIHTLNDPERIPEFLDTKSCDVVMLDMNYSGSDTSGKEGLYWLRKLMSYDHPPQVVMITAFATIENAIQALKQGATDFVIKPWENEKLVATMLSAYQLSKSRQEVRQLRITQDHLQKDIDKQFGEFVGQSKAMKELYGIISKVAKTDANVIILGENGTGKELVARSIHRLSLRAHKPMISVDLGSISETLFESELFGHVKGAFTDAREDRAGRFEIASGSTLFFDEIGNVPLTLQAKLLTALQNRVVTRLGSNKQVPVDIRLICATNVSIYDKVMEGAFREDLLYRIKTIELHLPPLREREGDVELLTCHFLEMYGRKYRKQVMKLGADTLRKLERYSWPGNVRELQHAVERAVILSDHRILKPEDFYLHEPVKKHSVKDALTLDELEEATIKKALDKNTYNISKTAAELGLSRAALYRKIQKYDIK
ncbi:MAG: sigma-54-dependent Fis family transcriptional regulator [Sphingobacteriales bacterium]|nr:MAG: sigma-54-dependent Fis family transcriptional regulator [Sphingobacteriales bacterium]